MAANINGHDEGLIMMKLDHDKKQNNGFTLLELMIVITILFIIVQSSAPKIYSAIARYNFSNDIRMMMTAINKARVHSMRTGEITVVQFIPNTSSGQATFISFVDNGLNSGISGNGIWDGGEKVIQQGSFHSGITMNNPAFSSNILNDGKSISFNSQGLPWGFNSNGVPVKYSGIITLTTQVDSETLTKHISISSGGYVSVD